MTGRRLEGRVAVVTGAGSGIGRATASCFAAEGAAVVVNDRHRELADEAVAAIVGAGGIASAHCGDVGSSRYVDSLVASAVDRYGRLDVMHNNAGYGLPGVIGETTDREFDEMIRVNLNGTMYGVRAAVRVMMCQGSGSIINTASTAAFAGAANRASYGVAKAGVINLTKSTAADYGRYGIRANAICPGPIETPAFLRFAPDVDYYRAQIPMRRLGRPEDVAALALFLASDDSAFVSGTAILCDGALLARLNGPYLSPDDVTA